MSNQNYPADNAAIYLLCFIFIFYALFHYLIDKGSSSSMSSSSAEADSND